MDYTEYLGLAKRISKHDPPIRIDVMVEGHGGLFLFRAVTFRANQWIEENVSREGFQPYFPTLIVENRYAHVLAAAMKTAGLVIR